MSKARDLANAGTALGAVTATELGYVDGVTSAIQTQIDSKEATLPSQTGNSGKYLTTNGSAKSWGTVSQYALPSQTGNSGKYLTTNGTAESWGTVTVPTAWNPATIPDNPSTGDANFQNGRTEIVYANGYYVFGTDSGFIWASSDGATWTVQKIGTSVWYALAYGNGTFVIGGGGGEIYTATNPTSTWTSRTSSFSAGAVIGDLVYVAGSINLFLISNIGSTTTGQAIIASSPDGITWTNRRNAAANGQVIISIAHNNSTIFASAGVAAQGAYSTNGTSWTTTNPGTGETVDYIEGSLARFVGLSSNATSCITQTAANIATAWSTSPTTCFIMHFDNTNLRGANNPTCVRGAPIYDSVRNRYYMIGSNTANLYLNTYDASTLVTNRTSSGSHTIYNYKLIKSEALPAGWNIPSSSNLTGATLGYGNNRIVYAVNMGDSGMRIFYADIA